MAVFVGKVFTATTAGRRLEAVQCEKCGTGFHYELVRVGVGKGSSPYMLFQDSAWDRAKDTAARDLERRLTNEAELVACPKCNWVNEALVERYRRRQFRGAIGLIVLIMVAGPVAAVLISIALSEALGYASPVPRVVMFVVMGISLASPAWVLWIRGMVRRRIDPNRTFPERPVVPAGTPPALVIGQDARTGANVVERVAAQTDEGDAPSEWAVFRPGQMKFPCLCCICMGLATTEYAAPFKVSAQVTEIRMPLCGTCDSRLLVRWWLVALGAALGTFGVAAILALVFPSVDTLGRWFVFGFVGIFGSLFSVALLPNWVCRPYRYGVVDADRGIVRLAARNPEFTAMLVAQVRAREGGGK